MDDTHNAFKIRPRDMLLSPVDENRLPKLIGNPCSNGNMESYAHGSSKFGASNGLAVQGRVRFS